MADFDDTYGNKLSPVMHRCRHTGMHMTDIKFDLIWYPHFMCIPPYIKT